MKRMFGKTSIACILARSFVLFSISLFVWPNELRSEGGVPPQSNTEIIWDTYGVPHVYAGSLTEMYYAFGWAQMHNHANLLLRLYGIGRGQAAEYWGSDYLA